MVNYQNKNTLTKNNLITPDHLDLQNKLDTGNIITLKKHIQINTPTNTQTTVHRPRRKKNHTHRFIY